MTDTELLIRETLVSYADEAELVDLVHSAKARSRELDRGRGTNRRLTGSFSLLRNRRVLAYGGLVGVVALLATAFVLGGKAATPTHAQLTQQQPRTSTGRLPLEFGTDTPPSVANTAPHGPAATSNGSAVAAQPTAAAVAGVPQSQSASTGSGVTATRVVKTGALGLRVAKGAVPGAVTRLTALATSSGGYVSQSRTGNVQGLMYGDLTLRVPVAHFESTIAAAEQLGKETSLTTNAQDVTGKVVDLQARLSALRQTRQTYLTILSHATTIGQTLAVQQRVNDVQRQIEELQGELKVLRNQSAAATLQVSISQPGASSTVIVKHPPRHGIDKAWHTSIDRFARGIDAIVAALGPLLLALLVVAFIALVGAVGYRVVRRVTA